MGGYFFYTLSSLLGIIIVSYEYAWFIGVFRWSPKVWDTIAPIGLGFSQVAPMFSLTNPEKWWLWNSIFCAVGGLSFANSIWNCNRKLFGENGDNEKAFRITIIGQEKAEGLKRDHKEDFKGLSGSEGRW